MWLISKAYLSPESAVIDAQNLTKLFEFSSVQQAVTALNDTHKLLYPHHIAFVFSARKQNWFKLVEDFNPNENMYQSMDGLGDEADEVKLVWLASSAKYVDESQVLPVLNLTEKHGIKNVATAAEKLTAKAISWSSDWAYVFSETENHWVLLIAKNAASLPPAPAPTANPGGRVGKNFSPPKTDVFLSHDWGTDTLGRNNHQRVGEINKILKNAGLVTWFDEQGSAGEAGMSSLNDIDNLMAGGIDNTKVVLVFLTENYIEKCKRDYDNCKAEFLYANSRGKQIIPVVMESKFLSTAQWTGPIGLRLSGSLYVNCSDDSALPSGCEQLVERIQHLLKQQAE